MRPAAPSFLHRFVRSEDGLRLHVADYPGQHAPMRRCCCACRA
jgi:hypothetical protein